MTPPVVIVGGGHNGLVAAAVLARRGVGVLVLERGGVVGGACRTERPFETAPGLGCSTAAYLLGPMLPEVLARTGVDLPLRPRRPSGFLIADSGEPAWFGLDGGLGAFGEHDRAALASFDAALGAVRDDLAPLWLQAACPLGEAVRAVRAAAVGEGAASPRELARLLAFEPFSAVLGAYGFRDRSLALTLATDAMVGSSFGLDEPGLGMNFLAHNMLRLPAGGAGGGDGPLGAWQLVEGGMGAVTGALRASAEAAGAEVRTGCAVLGIEPGEAGVVVALESGERVSGSHAVLACDPFAACGLLGRPAVLASKLEGLRTPGTSLKVNLALRDLPEVLGEDVLGGRHPGATPLSGTVHVLPHPRLSPGGGDPFAACERGRRAALRGELPDPFDLMIDVYTHTAVDGSLRDDSGRHAMSFFVQWVPPGLSEGEAAAYAQRIIDGPARVFMPGLPGLVEEIVAIPPRGIERRFGITGGHIHHIDNRFAFSDRLAATDAGHERVVLGCAGCHPAGSVIGCAGLIAADLVLAG